MKEYTVKSEKGRISRLFHEGSEWGLLKYKSWFSMNAELELSHKKLSLNSVGFWKNRMVLLENETELMSYRMDWKGMSISWGDKIYRIKPTGIFSRTFVLTETGSNEPLLTLNYRSKWRTVGGDFVITSSEGFEALPEKNVFLLTAISAVNYYVVLVAAAA